MTIDRASGSAMILLGAFVIWERRVLPLGTHTQPGPGYLPLVLAMLLVLLGALLVWHGGQAAPLSSVAWPEFPHATAILACTVFATALLERIGYRLTMFAILLFLFGVMERLRPWLALALALGLSLGTFWLFDSLLRVPLPRGAWGF
ncbi:MAG: tripartite tricarboxylate transporter TctB family protein [Candidatus Methylomirabilota bacterium]